MDVYRQIRISKTRGTITSKKDGNPNLDDDDLFIMKMGEPCDFFVLILEGHVEVTIGREEHKFQEGPFRCFGEQMLEQAMMIPPSPHISTQDNNSRNIAMNSNNLRKVNNNTSTHISNNDISTNNKMRMETLPLNKQTWTPDYTLRAVTDCIYLKIRKNTYLVAIKASRMNNMNSEVDGNIIKEQELEEYLKKITENDADFTGVTPNIMSPDNLWQTDGKMSSYAGTPTEFRRESIRSSLSMMKQKIFGTGAGGMGRSCTSIDKPGKDDFWDGMTNPALSTSKEDVSDSTQESGKVEPMDPSPTVPAATSIPLTSVVPEVNFQTRNHDIKVGNNTTVISVRGSGSSKDNTNNENDKTVANNAHGVNERTSSFNKDDLENPVS